MKKFVTLLLCMLPISLFAQVNDGIRQAMDTISACFNVLAPK